MKVPLREIPCHRSVTLGPDFVSDAIRSLAVCAALERGADESVGQAQAELDLYIESETVFVRGHIDGWLEVACSRCVEAARIVLDDELAVSYLPRAQVPADDEDEEIEAEAVAEDDIDVFPYDGEEIDLTPLLREQLILAIPYAPLCTEDCKGLCTVCGSNLNAGECGCDRKVLDPRLAALKNLKV